MPPEVTIVELPIYGSMRWAVLFGPSGQTYAEFRYSVDAVVFAALLISGRVTTQAQGEGLV